MPGRGGLGLANLWPPGPQRRGLVGLRARGSAVADAGVHSCPGVPNLAHRVQPSRGHPAVVIPSTHIRYARFAH
jgi:hypothetical protein